MQLAAELRRLREKAGSPTYRVLAERAHYSVATLAGAASGKKMPSLPVTLAYVRACGGDVQEWEQRWRTLAAEIAAGDEQPDDADVEASPYMGLAAFQPADAQWFFGRARVVEDLAALVARHRFVAVFGASGAGKSSVLRAGLAPRFDDAVVFTPGARPLEECAIHLARLVGSMPGALLAEIAADPRNLHRALRQTGRQVTVVVDQFEEIFTLCQDHEERDRFLEALLIAANAETSNCRVVLGVRADFYAHCTRHPDLVAALRDAHMMVGPMTTEELRQAITKPAVRADCTVEGALLAALVADAAGQSGVLPLLSHALRETWRRRRGNTLTLDGFRAAGGIDGALAQSAESVYAALPSGQQQLAKDLFLRLTAPGEGTEDTKRRVARGELDDGPDITMVLQHLVDARLLTVDHDSVEIAHEALIRCWPRLHDWLSDDREGLRIHRQLTEATDGWERLGHDPGALYRGIRLSLARQWATRHRSALSLRERTFLDTAVAAEERERAADLRRTRRLRRLVALLTVLVLVAAATTVIAFRAQQNATGQRNIALSQKAAAQATVMRAANPALSAQLSLAAYRLAGTPEARGSLLSAFALPYAARLTGHESIVESAAFSPDGRTLATSSDDRTARLWDVTDPHRAIRLATLTGHSNAIRSVAFSPNGHALATASDDATTQLWDVADPRRPVHIATLASSTENVWSVAFSPDGHTLAVASDEQKTVRLWDVTDPHTPSRLAALTGHTDTVLSVRFSPDGHMAATTSDDHTARLWDITNPRAPQQLADITGHTATVWSAVFSPDGRLLATGSADHTVRLWDIADPHRPVQLSVSARHSDAVRSVAFSPDGHTLASAGNDHTVRLWSIADPRHLAERGAPLTGNSDNVVSVAFSPNGHALAATSDDHTARLWDLPGSAITAHTDFVFGVAFNPDGRTLATTSQDHTVRLWDLTHRGTPTALAVITGHTDNVYNAAFSPDGRTLATTSEDHTVRLWDLTDRRNPAALSQITIQSSNPEGVTFSPDGHILAAASDDHNIRLWDVTRRQTPTQLAALADHNNIAWAVAFSPDGHTLATTSQDNTARLWDVTDLHHPAEQAVLTGHTEGVRAVAFSPDGHTLATASDDQTTRLWNVTDPHHPAEQAVLTGHTEGVRAVAFSPDGHTLATASDDQTTRLWNVTDPHHPAEQAVLTGHTDRIHSVAFSPDGHTLATGSRDTTALLWDTDADRIATRVCATAFPAITRAEWDKYLPGLPYQPPCRQDAARRPTR
ncbi:nSTAND1 domain-containing NTPase [Streptomyces sp. HUAS TT7]|uniref:nSTAND1 domain-containing NTPase n=1 Tax=Streptomyces sp. HUAS TT7 TaxID=3447507 RepID=UPI003F6603DF